MLREAAEAIQSKLPYADWLACALGGAIPANCDDCRSAALAAHPDRGGSADAFAAVSAAYARCAKTYTELGPQADAIFQVREQIIRAGCEPGGDGLGIDVVAESGPYYRVAATCLFSMG